MSLFRLGSIPHPIPPPGYAYRCEDKGILKPLLYRFFVEPIARALPASVAANDVTIVAEALSLAPVIIFTLFSLAPGWVIALLPGLGLFGYVVLDHVDGTHARRTGTSGPLGEFVDHWFDGWNGGLVPFGIMLAWGASGPAAVINVVFGSVAYTIAIAEQRVTRTLKLDRISGNEGMMMTWATYVILGLLGLEEARTFPILREWPVVGTVGFGPFLIFFTWWGTLGTAKNVLVRMRGDIVKTFPDIVPIFLSGALVLGWNHLGLPRNLACWIQSTIGAIVAGRSVLAITTGLPLRWDAVGPLAVAAGLGATFALRLDARVTELVGFGVLAVCLARAFADLFWALEALGRWLRPGELLSFIAPRPRGEPVLEGGSRR